MMRLSPIIKRDIEIKSRSLTLPMLMTVFNALLFVVGMAGASGIILSMKENLAADYGAFLKIYVLVAAIEYLFLLFVSPLFTAGSISGERERGTLDLLLTTRLTSVNIVLEKLLSAFVSMCVVAVSGLPALLVPLMCGGVHIQNTILLVLVMIIEASLILSIGMFSSCIGRSSVHSIAIAYAVTVGLLAGPLLIAGLMSLFSSNGGNSAVYLIAIDPLLPVTALLAEQTGEMQLLNRVFLIMNSSADPGFIRNAAFIGIVLQTALNFGFVVLSVIYVMPGRSILKLKVRQL